MPNIETWRHRHADGYKVGATAVRLSYFGEDGKDAAGQIGWRAKNIGAYREVLLSDSNAWVQVAEELFIRSGEVGRALGESHGET